MAVDESWLLNKSDTCNISKNVKKHIRHGRHRTKYTFDDDPVSFKLFVLCYVYFQKHLLRFRIKFDILFPKY